MKENQSSKERVITAFHSFFQNGTFKFFYSGIKLAYENYRRANSALWVTSLCYFTLVSIVPMAAILFSFGNWLGAGGRLMEKLTNNSPLNEETVSLILNFAENLLENARNGLLAGIGFVFLGWTLISMFSIIEKAFNDIWHVKKSRVLLRKITDYLSFIIFTPLFILIVNDGTTTVISKNLKGAFSIYLMKFVPYFAVLVFMTAVYMLMPNTKVKFFPAFCSAIFTSVLTTVFQNAIFILQSRINTYNKIYGSFAILFIFLFWLRILWFFLILGGHLSYFLQNRYLHSTNKIQNINFRTKEYCALSLIVEFARAYKNDKEPLSKDDLSKITDIPVYIISDALTVLKGIGIIAEVANGDDEEKRYFIIKNVEALTFGDLLNGLESYGEDFDSKFEKSDLYNKYLKIVEEKLLETKISDLI
ncbi:YihY/virulence factor BrkB family protein [Fusobacterium sp. PH5-44]|uniref:YihY/virulence factor BrkB family protein n=1 Tax=unclassified Fusobacterium TaxID=2648384 RepID=UPI003D24440B